MKVNESMPNWLKKYCKYIFISDSYDLEYEQIGNIETIKKYSNFDYLPDQYESIDFLVGDRVQAQIKLLKNLHKEGIIK